MSRPSKRPAYSKCAACGTPCRDPELPCVLCAHTEFKPMKMSHNPSTTHDRVIMLVKTIQRVHERSVEQFTRGDCYRMFEILRNVWRGAEPWYDEVDGHVLTAIDGGLYDIKGLRYWVGRQPTWVKPWRETLPSVREQAHEWKWTP